MILHPSGGIHLLATKHGLTREWDILIHGDVDLDITVLKLLWVHSDTQMGGPTHRWTSEFGRTIRLRIRAQLAAGGQ